MPFDNFLFSMITIFLCCPKLNSGLKFSAKVIQIFYFAKFIFLFQIKVVIFVKNKLGSYNTRFNGKLNLNFAASVEFGINFLLSHTHLRELRLAVFADYGMLNINPTHHSNNDFVYIPAIKQVGFDPNIVKYNSLLTSNIKSPVNPFIAGIKLTLLLSFRHNNVAFSYKDSKWWVISSKKRSHK